MKSEWKTVKAERQYNFFEEGSRKKNIFLYQQILKMLKINNYWITPQSIIGLLTTAMISSSSQESVSAVSLVSPIYARHIKAFPVRYLVQVPLLLCSVCENGNIYGVPQDRFVMFTVVSAIFP